MSGKFWHLTDGLTLRAWEDWYEGVAERIMRCSRLTSLTKSASLSNLSNLPRLFVGPVCWNPIGAGVTRGTLRCCHDAKSARRKHGSCGTAMVATATGPSPSPVLPGRAKRSRADAAYVGRRAMRLVWCSRREVLQGGGLAQVVRQARAEWDGQAALDQTGWSACSLPWWLLEQGDASTRRKTEVQILGDCQLGNADQASQTPPQ